MNHKQTRELAQLHPPPTPERNQSLLQMKISYLSRKPYVLSPWARKIIHLSFFSFSERGGALFALDSGFSPSLLLCVLDFAGESLNKVKTLVEIFKKEEFDFLPEQTHPVRFQSG